MGLAGDPAKLVLGGLVPGRVHHALVARLGDGELGVQVLRAVAANAAGRLGDGAGELGGPQVGPEAAADGVDVGGHGVRANVVLAEAVNVLPGAGCA